MRNLEDVLKGIFWGMLVCAIITLCAGCRTQYVPVPTIQKEYVYQTKNNVIHDSIYTHDSIRMYIIGDTIYKDKVVTRYVEKLQYITQRDTICKQDSIAVPYEVTKYRTPPFNWWVMSIELIVSLLLMGAVFFLMKRR